MQTLFEFKRTIQEVGTWCFGLAVTVVAMVLMASPASGQNATVIEIENIVQTARGDGAAWTKATPKQTLAAGDRIRTRQRSRATLALTGLYTLRIDQFTTVEITPALVDSSQPTLDLLGGAAFIFSRERDGEIGVKMPAANAALRGTQLVARVWPGGKSFIQVLEGSVELSNSHGRLTLAAGEAGEAAPGQAPRRTAVIEAHNILQWALYYPAVIDPADLGLRQVPAGPLANSLAAYRRGNLLAAVDSLPERAPVAAADRLYHAAVLLAVGRLDEARGLLAGVPQTHPGKRALQRMLAAVFREQVEPWATDSLATASEALAESYYLQAWAKLEPARLAALRATELSPQNGFAWVRLAELEFSAGRTREARTAIDKGLGLTPENARAHALRGFVLSADNRIAEARAAFEEAVRLDGGFGNGWLGLGLTKIKQGHLAAGRADLQTAATVEPTQSIFHSYLGKAMSQEGRKEEAAKDLALAAKLDPYDPTPPLYSALEAQRNNRPNAAIADLEKSLALTDYCRIYRSEFLLDQDRAVRNANLARMYQNAGMREVAVREATRAVESDYTNPSAHLFLANAFDAMRDPDRILLRHETPWFNELLLANLLSPVGGGALSQFVSQQEYSKLLEADGLGGSLTTDWRSSSELRTTASLFGTHGNVSYGLDAYYRNDDGDRLNSDMEIRELYGQLKWQASPDDTFYFLGKWAAQKNGDLFETYDNRSDSPAFRFDEDQHPGLLLGGWNHRWGPGSHTLLLAGRLAADQNLTDPLSSQLLVQRTTDGMRPGFIHTNVAGDDVFTDPALRFAVPYPVSPGDGKSVVYSPDLLAGIAPYLGTGALDTNFGPGVTTHGFDFATRRQWEIYLAEIQHIQQMASHTVLLGGRWQEGRIETDARLNIRRPTFAGGFTTPAVDQHVESDYRRTGLYAYDYWRVTPAFTFIGGLSWDRVDHPDNFRNPPVNSEQRTDEELSGKLGFTWTPRPWFTLRGAAAQGMGGLSFDESVRLEPSQIAGFGQAYRTLISESLVGSVETPVYQLAGLAAEGKLTERTWWGVTASVFDEEVDRTLGMFTGYDSPAFGSNTPVYFPDGTPQRLDYREQSLSLTVNQLLGDEFAVGGGYRVTRSRLRTELPGLAGWAGADLTDKATLHEIRLYADWNSPSGWFAHLEGNWFSQDLDEDPARGVARPGDDFSQINAWVGYRFASNLCELRAGVLNLGGTDYHLSPLNPHSELARDRTFFALCRLSF
ncbi:MAG: TonB-dependent receptor [Akkermansiaceae bacterium]|nr:TonB-dependent receptor [Akkermansiaceae bacterium]MCF7732013.1 TonB-dependent receptor [Akkermansiaceae bacterium]